MVDYVEEHVRDSTLEVTFTFSEDVSDATLTGFLDVDGSIVDFDSLSVIDAVDYSGPLPADYADFTAIKGTMVAENTLSWPTDKLVTAQVKAALSSGRVVRSAPVYIKIMPEVDQS